MLDLSSSRPARLCARFDKLFPPVETTPTFDPPVGGGLPVTGGRTAYRGTGVGRCCGVRV